MVHLAAFLTAGLLAMSNLVAAKNCKEGLNYCGYGLLNKGEPNPHTETTSVNLCGALSRLTRCHQEITTTRSLRSSKRTGRASTRSTSLRAFSAAGGAGGSGSRNSVITGAVMVAVGTAISAHSGMVMAVKVMGDPGRWHPAGCRLVQL